MKAAPKKSAKTTQVCEPEPACAMDICFMDKNLMKVCGKFPVDERRRMIKTLSRWVLQLETSVAVLEAGCLWN
jgi:hypothetical protein